MFYNIHEIWQYALLFVSFLTTAFIIWKKPAWGAWLVIFFAPLYLLKIGSWPITVLEALIWVFIVVWAIKKGHICHPEFISGSSGEAKALRCRNKFGMTIKKIRNDLFWPVLMILSGVLISTIFSSDIKTGLGILKSWFLAPIIFAFILGDIFGENGLKKVFSALFASAAAVAIISFFYLAFSRLTFDGRLTAFYLSPNHLAMWLAPGIIAGLGLWFYAKKTYQRILLLIVNCLLLIVLYFTYSYGAWLGLATAAIFALFYFWKYKIIDWRRLFIVNCLLLILLAFVIFLQLGDGHASAKLINLFSSPRSSWQSRLMVWRAAIEILKDHWLIGIGPGLFQPYYLAFQKFFPPYLEWAVPQPHNLFLAWWLQTGLVGLIGFLWLLRTFFKNVFRVIKKPPCAEASGGKQNHLPVLLLVAMMVYFLVHGLVDATFWKNDLALIFWVLVLGF